MFLGCGEYNNILIVFRKDKTIQRPVEDDMKHLSHQKVKTCVLYDPLPISSSNKS